MRTNTGHLLLAAATSASLAAACGGGQRGDARWWSSADELVPADASWAFVTTPDERTADEVLAAQAALALGPANPVFDWMRDSIGVDPRSPTFFAETGLDPAGQSAVFSTALLPVMVFELADESAFSDTIERALDANPDAAVVDVEYAGHAFRRIALDPLAIDVGVVEGWAVVRLTSDSLTADVDDEAFASLLSERPASTLLDTPEAAALLAHAGAGSRTTAIGVLRTAPLSQATETLLLALDSRRDNLGAMGLSRLATRYRNEDEQARCADAAERFATSVPWVGFVMGRDATDPNLSHGATVVQLSMAAAEQLRTASRPIAPSLAEEGADAAIFVAGGLDATSLLAQNTADPALMRCPNVAAIPGAIARMRDELGAARIERFQAMSDGRAALAIYDVRFAGFLPFVDAALSLGSPNPVLLAEPLQRQIERSGGQGTVDPTAAHTVITYDLLHLDLLLAFNDRNLALGVGEVPPRTLNAMLETPNSDTIGAFMVYRLWGPRLADILEGAAEWAKNNGSLTPELDTSLQQMIATYRRAESMTVRATVEESQLVLRLESRMTPP